MRSGSRKRSDSGRARLMKFIHDEYQNNRMAKGPVEKTLGFCQDCPARNPWEIFCNGVFGLCVFAGFLCKKERRI